MKNPRFYRGVPFFSRDGSIVPGVGQGGCSRRLASNRAVSLPQAIAWDRQLPAPSSEGAILRAWDGENVGSGATAPR